MRCLSSRPESPLKSERLLFLARSVVHGVATSCLKLTGGLKGSTQHFILEGRDGVDAMERGYVRGFDAVAKAELWERLRLRNHLQL